MENLRLIRERIKSCISCSEEQCPFIKERLEQHVLSHHSASSRPSISNHRIRSRPSLQLGKTSPIRSRISFIASDQETSTTDLNNSNKGGDYKESLRSEVLEWSKDLTVYRNPNFEDLKQNVLNELIEKIDRLLSDANKELRDFKIKDEIDNVVDSLPTYSEEQGGEMSKNNLKEKLLNRINKLKSEYLDTVPDKLNFTNQTSEIKQNGKRNVRDMATSTPQIINGNSNRTSTIMIPLNNDDVKSVARPKKFADAEVQHSLAATPHYNNIFKPKVSNVNSDKDLFKQQIYDWFNQVLDRYDENNSLYSNNNLIDNLFDNLKQSLSRNVNSTNYKLTLKAKIFEFLDDLPLRGLNRDRTYVNNLAEDLANRLLCVKINTDNFKQTYYSDACLHECAMEVMGLNFEEDLNLKSSIYDVVLNQLREIKFYRSDIINNITNLFYEKISTGTNFGPQSKVEVFKLLKNSTDLCDTIIIATINSIVKRLKRINVSINDNNILNSISHGIEIPILPKAFSIYQSENTFREPQNHSATSNASRRSSILKKENNNTYSAEQLYTENISNIIKDWINSIPKNYKKAEAKLLKDTVYSDLANDILDQVKLEQIAPETRTERRKYITFLTLRWLIKVEYFKDINDAKPYIAKLIEKIESISIPYLIHLESNNSIIVSESIHQISDDLEDKIARWLDEQPTNTFNIMDQSKRNKTIQKFSQNIRERLHKNRPSNEITKEIVKWLSKLIKPDEKSTVNELAERLQNEILKPNKGTDVSNITGDKPVCCEANVGSSPDFDEVLREIIKKYLEYYYDEDNSIARDAFGCIFKTELQKLRIPSKKQAYDNFIKNIQNEDFLQDRLKKELQYTSVVSDWLLTIPVSDFFNTVTNKSRPQQVDKIVKHICDSDEKGHNFADNVYEKIINELPIHPIHEVKVKMAIEDLSCKIAAVRPPTPCCNYAHQTSSLNSSGVQEDNLSDFIEDYVRTNGNEVMRDELKFNALTSLIEKEMEKSYNRDSSFEDHKIMDTSIPGKETIKKFSYKLGCVKEISNWLNNLPLQPVTDKVVFDKILKAIKKLVEEMAEKFITTDTTNLHNNTELVQFIKAWISELPLTTHRNIDMATATQQLINRVERVNRGKDGLKKTINSKPKETSGYICPPPHTCCNKSKSNKTINHDPATVIVETIEKWCNDLPIQTENEMITKELKDNIARKIYQTISEINREPDYFNNDSLYEKALSDELERQLQNMPQNQNLKNKKEILKTQLIQVILDNKNMIKEKDAAETYKMLLEKTVEISMPYPIQAQQKSKNYKFEIFKDRLAAKFILDNFDHSNDEIRINYENKIKDDIDKYFQQDQRRNVIPVTKDEVINKLYSVLFQVVPPKNNSMSQEIEEIKTKCEIENWFQTLPLQAAKSDKDLLDWDKILAMLAKRLHQMEKSEQNPNEKMHKEISKWLIRLPLLPKQEQNIDYFADDLQARLKSTENNRDYKDSTSKNTNKSNTSKGILGTTQVAGPSNEGQAHKSSILQACCHGTPLTPIKPAELILELVESWCNQLPLPANTHQEVENVNLVKGNLIMKIIIKISELNVNPETFNDEQLYDTLLEDELQNLLSSLPISLEFMQNKNSLINQLVVAIKSVKNLIKEDNSRYEYKQKLKSTIERVLEDPVDQTVEQVTLFHTLKDEILDNFIEYSFNDNDIEKQQLCKKVIRDNVAICCTKNKENSNSLLKEDPLITGNQLISELSKIPSPGKPLIIDEVQEIQLRTEITKLFNLIPPCNSNKTDLKSQIKTTLAKRLNDFEKVGYTSRNKIKIKNEIIKCLNKLDANIDNGIIDKFIEDLEKTAAVRKVSVTKTNFDIEGSKDVPVDPQKFYEIPHYSCNELTRESSQNSENCQSKGCGSEWISLLSATPLTNVHEPIEMKKRKQNFRNKDNSFGETIGTCSNVDHTDMRYKSFQRDMPCSSSPIEKDLAIASLPKLSSNTSHGNSNPASLFNETGNADKKCNQTCQHHQQKQMLGSSNSNCSHLPEKSQCQMPNCVLANQNQQTLQTKPTTRFQHPRCFSRNLDCTSEQNIRSVPGYQSPMLKPQQPSSSYTAPTYAEYPRNQISIPEDIQQQPYIPLSIHHPQRRASVLSNSGRPCRRPSITILKHEDMTSDNNNLRRLQQPEAERVADVEDDDDVCLCEGRKQFVCKGNSSCPTQQKYCRICNGFKPYYCGPSPYRYPGFYYY